MELVLDMTQCAIGIELQLTSVINELAKREEKPKVVFGSVRNLYIGSHQIPFINILWLISICPSLRYFGCRVLQLDIGLEDVRRMTSNGDSLNKNLNTPSISGMPESVSNAVAMVSSIALQCPNLEQLEIPAANREIGFKEKWYKVLTWEECQSHASRLQSLVI